MGQEAGFRRVHIVGVAGSGMSALAETALACGITVSGSDRSQDQGQALDVLARLQACGCILYRQDGSGVRDGAEAVVVSTAIETDNPDLLAARAGNLPVLHRSRFLADLIGARSCLGVAGTSGKSTVTGMVGWILGETGLDPMVVNGAAVSDWEAVGRTGSVRHGNPDCWVVELDESDRSLLRFSPDHAVITNCSADHFPLAETQELFADFRAKVRRTCVEGPWYAEQIVLEPLGSRFCIDGVAFSLQIPGCHNVQNAVAACALCRCLGIDTRQSAAALSSFKGIRRRLEVCGTVRGVTVLDDFAHNPAKIGAALEAVLPYYRRTTAVWRPHGYGPLRNLLPELARAFRRLADGPHCLYLLPVYDAGGTAERNVCSGDLADLLLAAGVAVQCVSTGTQLLEHLQDAGIDGREAVLVMGARDPGLPLLARQILRWLEQRDGV